MTAESGEEHELRETGGGSRSPRTPRPALYAALALGSGGAAGSLGMLEAISVQWLLLLLAVLAISSLCLRGRSASLAALCALFVFSGLRVRGPTSLPRSLDSTAHLGEDFGGERGLESGRIEILQRRPEHSQVAVIEPGHESRPPLSTPTGILRAGERALRLPGGTLTRKPRGFVRSQGRRASGEVAEIRVEPDEWIRQPASGTSKLSDLNARAGAQLELWRMSLARDFLRLDDERTARLLASICFGIVLERKHSKRYAPPEQSLSDPGHEDLRERRAPDGSDADLFTRTGTRHLLAVSGLHVGLVALLLFGPVSRLITLALRPFLRERRRELMADISTLLALAIFVTLAGARAPVQRAGLALAFLILASNLLPGDAHSRRLGLRRRIDPLSALGAALLVECLLHPGAMLSLSVQLSYAATLGLLLWTRPLSARMRVLFELSDRDRSGRMRSPNWQRPAAKLLAAFRDGFAASLAATLATLPFAAATFGEFSAIGAIATPLCLPLFAGLLVGAWIYWAFPIPLLGECLVNGTHMLFGALEFFDRLPGTPIQLPPRPFLLVAFACWCAGRHLETGRGLPGRLAALVGGALLLPWTAAPAGLELIALDVGHGTAVLFRAPGEPGFVFDAGSRDRPRVADDAVLPQLRAWDPPSLRIACSHAHRDHASALPRIARRFPVTEWLGAAPIQPLRSERSKPSYRELDQLEIGWMSCSARGPWRVWLGRGGVDLTSLNECSRDLLLEHRDSGRRILLCGDAEAEGRAELLRTVPPGAPLDLCLLPHHGTARGQLGPLLDLLQPRQVWISRGEVAPAEAEVKRREIPLRGTYAEGPLHFHASSERPQTVQEEHSREPPADAKAH